MEHLLFLTHRIPYPPNKGDKIRSYHMLKHLAQRYRLHLGTFVDDADDWQYTETVKALCEETHFAALAPRRARVRSLGALAANRALSLDYYRDAGLHAWVDATVARHPISRVLVFSSPMAQYALSPRLTRRIADFVDVDSDKWKQYSEKKLWPMRWLYRHEARQLLRYEQRIARAFDATLFVSQPEAQLFRQLASGAATSAAAADPRKIGFFNNGVDIDYFSPAHVFPDPYPPRQTVLVFTGAMDYWPNIDAVQWFARAVLPALRAARPELDVQFYIVGAKPAPRVAALTGLPGVHVTGAVPDIRPYLAHARLAVAPLRIARGIQNKVLEAMAMGKPVLVSPQALEGIDAVPGRELLLADSAAQFAAAAAALLQPGNGAAGADTCAALGAAARRKIVTAYSWSKQLTLLDTLLDGSQPIHFS